MINFCNLCKNRLSCEKNDYLVCKTFEPNVIGRVFTADDLAELHNLIFAQHNFKKSVDLNRKIVENEKDFLRKKLEKKETYISFLESENKELTSKLDDRNNDIAWLKKALSIALDKLPGHTIRFSASVEISPNSLVLDENLSGDLLIRFTPKEGDN